jgi:hypothetical protein
VDTSSPYLTMLGRRIERLMYLGILLLVLCFAEVYLASANLSFRNEDSFVFEKLAVKLNAEKDQLDKLFNATITVTVPAATPRAETNAERRQRLADAAVRRKLGLPPDTGEPQKPSVTTVKSQAGYQDFVRRAAIDVAFDSQFDVDTMLKEVDATKSPSDIVSHLRTRSQELLQKSVRVWGIETPRQIPMNYLGIDYRVPSTFAAGSLLIALTPLLIGWIGSLYVTRQRELVAIEKLQDFTLVFPHILNMFPLLYSEFAQYKSRSEVKFNRVVGRALILFVRWIVLALFSFPMLASVAYSAYGILSPIEDLSFWWLALSWIVGIVMLLQIFALLFQEWFLVQRKEFNVR